MKNKSAKKLLLFYTISLFIVSNSAKAQSKSVVVDKEQVKKEIQAKENEFAEIYNSGKLKQIGYYAEDATSFAPNKKPIVGRAAIIDYLKVDVESNTDKISFTTKEVFVSSNGLMVVEVGYYEVVDSNGTSINTGNYMSLFEKRNGKYYCLRDMSASDMLLE